MPNQRIEGHPLIGTRHVYRADLTPYDRAADPEPGRLILGNGHRVQVQSVFKIWNDVPGLDMLYVFCEETRESTHVVPADLGLAALS